MPQKLYEEGHFITFEAFINNSNEGEFAISH